jgi:hypothetical protein
MSNKPERPAERKPRRTPAAAHESPAIKMSQVLTKLIAPFAHLAPSDEEYEVLLNMAVVAWNLSLLAEEQRPPLIDHFLAGGLPGADSNVTDLARELIDQLIERKQALFPDMRRLIVSYQLTRTGEAYHLKVVSGPISPQPKQD